MTGAARNPNIRHNIGFQKQAVLEEYRLKGKQGIGNQLTEIQGRKFHARGAVVHPCQLQKAFHQAPHLLGHGIDAVRKLLLLLLGIFRLPQKLRVGHDDRQGCFQLVGGVRHKLPLLIPCLLHRPNRPAGQQKAQPQKQGKAQKANQQASFQQPPEGGLLAGDVQKDDALAEGGDLAGKA